MPIALKATKYRPVIRHVILGAAAVMLLIVKYVYLLLLLFMHVYNVKKGLVFLFCYL